VTEERDSRGRTAGLLFGLGAYGSWGLYPAFFPLLKPAGAGEILAHRIVWTVLLMTAVLMMMRRPSDLSSITRRTWLLLTAASALISVNWLVYVWAVSNGHVVDAALGYFINPLVTVLIGVLFFGERLHRAQLAAVLIAAAGVAGLRLALGKINGPAIEPRRGARREAALREFHLLVPRGQADSRRVARPASGVVV
jgi:chloramphenicol-sensitive protein RarD